MPLENLFADDMDLEQDPRQKIWDKFGLTGNPFPGASVTSGHPHMNVETDNLIEAKIKDFIRDAYSKVIVVIGSQGIGKTNLLTAYANALKDKLSSRGFYIIRFFPDPEPTFDPLLRAILDEFGEIHLLDLITALKTKPDDERQRAIEQLATSDMKKVVTSMLNTASDDEKREMARLAFQWLLGLPIRKGHRDLLKIQFRLDTVESKTKALKDLFEISVYSGILKGIFLLLDELEKQGGLLTPSSGVKYLSALRALIDALPKYLFLMIALTTDVLPRYSEMLPALQGRLATKVELQPIKDEQEALRLYRFYLEYAKDASKIFAREKGWPESATTQEIIPENEVQALYNELKQKTTLEGVRQREFLNALHERASSKINS